MKQLAGTLVAITLLFATVSAVQAAGPLDGIWAGQLSNPEFGDAGGVTGDLLGGAVEITEGLTLLLLVALGRLGTI